MLIINFINIAKSMEKLKQIYNQTLINVVTKWSHFDIILQKDSVPN